MTTIIIEPLESRIAPAVFTVTTLADSNAPGTLRTEIGLANANAGTADTIVFAHLVHGKTVPLTGTIKLLSDLPQITDSVTIVGPVPGSATGITLNGNKHQIININATAGSVGLEDLTITNGQSESGGGVYANASTVAITDCTITGNHSVGSGGGVGFNGGSFTIHDSLITGNTAVAANGNASNHGGYIAEGGGIDCFDGGTLVVTNSHITGNTIIGGNALPGTGPDGGIAYGAGINGGGLISGGYTTITVTGSVISGNKAIGGTGASGANGSAGGAGSAGGNGGVGSVGGFGGGGGEAIGGGLHSMQGSTLTIVGSTISGNTVVGGNGGAGGAGGKGGAGGSGTGQPHAGAGGNGGNGGSGGKSGSVWGGGIESYADGHASTLSIQSSTISGNAAITGKPGAGGTGAAAGAGSYTVAGVVHHGSAGGKGGSGSSGELRGGGIWAGYYPAITSTGGSETVTLSQVTIAKNTARAGGGIYFYGVTATIHNSTISQNNATAAGGGFDESDSSVTVVSTIIAGNTSPADPDVFGVIADSHDLIGLVTSDTTLLNHGATDVNGTSTVPLNPLLGPLGFHDGGTTQTMLLSFLSPAIGTGSNPDSLTTDQNGAPRELAGLTDIGAVEEG